MNFRKTIPYMYNFLINNNNNELKFKIYHKINNKNDYIHFYLNQSNKTKSGILIGFFLRTLRIWSPHFLIKEFKHIHNSFSKLQYPKSFIYHAESKGMNIHKHTSHNMNKNKPNSNTNPIKRHIISPQNPTTTLIKKKIKFLRHKNHNLHNKVNKTISNEQLQKHKFPIQTFTKSVASIAINSTKEKQIENLNKRIYEHKKLFSFS